MGESVYVGGAVVCKRSCRSRMEGLGYSYY